MVERCLKGETVLRILFYSDLPNIQELEKSWLSRFSLVLGIRIK